MPLQDHEVTRALQVARLLAQAGVPVFVAPPAPGTKVGFALPPGWEHTRADASTVDHWQPGWALCAVGGVAADFIDIDPRNGGSMGALANQWPITYGRAATPSGGDHYLIAPLHAGKGELVAGIDLQGGRPDGSGRGFVFIAPTVRQSKVDGNPRPYRWLTEPDTQALVHQGRSDSSGARLAALLPQGKAKKKINSPDGPRFDDYYEETPHTVEQALRTITAKRDEITQHILTRGWGGFRAPLNGAAYTLGAYVGSGFMTEQQAIDECCKGIAAAGFPTSEESLRTIEVGVADGAQHPIRVVESRGADPLADAGGDGDGFASKLIDAADLDTLPDPEPLVAGWLYKDTLAQLVGQPGAYKSFIAVDLACCVALGRPWHGRPVTQSCVLYVVGEGLSGYKRRIAAWCEHNDVEQSELRGKLLLTRGAVQIGGQDWPGLSEWVLDHKAGLVVIDTRARATVGSEENSSSEQGLIIEYCHALRAATGGVLLTVHHTGHANGDAAERGRGTIAWRAAVDTELLLTKTGELTGLLKCDRQKDAESGQAVAVVMVKKADSLAVSLEAASESSEQTPSASEEMRQDELRIFSIVESLQNAGQTTSTRCIRAAASGMRNSRVQEALDRLVVVSRRLTELPGPRNARVYMVNPEDPGCLAEAPAAAAATSGSCFLPPD